MVRRSFEEWKALVNAKLIEICGLECDDIADYDYRQDWRSGVTPRQAAISALRAAMNS